MTPPNASDDLNTLLEALDHQHWQVRRRAVDALGKLSNSAIPGLLAALRDRDMNVHCSAAEALGQIGDPAAVAALLDALYDPYAVVGSSAAHALEQIGTPEALAALEQWQQQSGS